MKHWQVVQNISSDVLKYAPVCISLHLFGFAYRAVIELSMPWHAAQMEASSTPAAGTIASIAGT